MHSVTAWKYWDAQDRVKQILQNKKDSYNILLVVDDPIRGPHKKYSYISPTKWAKRPLCSHKILHYNLPSCPIGQPHKYMSKKYVKKFSNLAHCLPPVLSGCICSRLLLKQPPDMNLFNFHKWQCNKCGALGSCASVQGTDAHYTWIPTLIVCIYLKAHWAILMHGLLHTRMSILKSNGIAWSCKNSTSIIGSDDYPVSPQVQIKIKTL